MMVLSFFGVLYRFFTFVQNDKRGQAPRANPTSAPPLKWEGSWACHPERSEGSIAGDADLDSSLRSE